MSDGRYVAHRLLGAGARKEVWLATDTRLSRDIALAIVSTEGLDDVGRVRIDREARVMAQLGDHPNIVTVLDVGNEGMTPFIVSQYMSGGTLADRLAETPDNRLAVPDAVTVATEMARALEHAHKLGIIHRDVKPANVFFGTDGSSQLGDFGLAATTEETRLTAEGMVVGTVAYLPPEQTLGQELDPRSDLYSLGALLYETLTGRPPFVGENAVAVISQHLRSDPVSPRWHNASVSEDLESLVLRLLAKAPEDRPESATSVVEQLTAFATQPTPVAEGATSTPTRAPAGWGSFVGRAVEREKLTNSLEAALAGRATLVMVVGEPGIGKTRTVEELATEASMRGAQVLWGHSYEGDIGAPYLPFVDAFRGYTRALSTDTLIDVLASDVAELASLVPDIHARVPDVAELPKLEGEADRYRLYEAITSFLQRASRDTPLMLVLEDLHWADKPSLMLLQYLARSMDADRLFIVCTYRDMELERTHPLSDTLAALRREQLYERVLLRGMTLDEVEDMIDAVGGQKTPMQFAERLHTETRGNPFFVTEMLQHLAESGSLRFEEGQWVGTLESIEMALPEGVRDVVGRRLDRLSPDCNRMLTVAAAMTSGFVLETVSEVSGLDEDTALDALDEALGARIVQERREPRGSFDFTHALIRQTLYAELSTPRRARLHRQILDVIERTGADVAELAHHAFQSITTGSVDTAVSYAIQAGKRALDAVAFEDAAHHYDMALQALDLAAESDQGRRAEVLLEVADANAFAGAMGAALRAADAVAKIGMELDRADLVGLAALHRARHESLSVTTVDPTFIQLCEVAEEGLSQDDDHQPLRAKVLAAHAFSLANANPSKAIELAARALEVAQSTMDSAARHDALFTIARLTGATSDADVYLASHGIIDTLSADGGVLTYATIERRLDELRPKDDLNAQWNGLVNVLYRAYRDGKGDARREINEEMRQLATKSRSPVFETYIGYRDGVEALIEGRYEEGTADFRVFSERSRSYGFNEDGLNTVGLALVPAFREQGRLLSLLEPTRAVVGRVDQPAWQAGLALILAEVGNIDEAIALLDELVIASPETITGDVQVPYTRAMFAEVAATTGHIPAAEVLLEMMETDVYTAVIIGTFVYYGSMDRYRGLLFRLLGRNDEAVASQRSAIAGAELMLSPPWVARGQFDLARALVSRGADEDRPEATRLFNEALITAAKLGMTRLIEEATEAKLALQGIDPELDMTSSIAAVANSIQVNRPALRAGADGRLTLLFSDIVGYTAMNERLGDRAAHEILQTHNAVLRRHLLAHNGTEVKSEGDGFMLTFETPTSACLFALGFNAELSALDLGEGVGVLQVRVGIHSGEVIRDNDDFFGRTVIIAARIAAQASGGEILIGPSVATDAADHHLSFGPTRLLTLKGLSGEHEVHLLDHG